MSTQSSISSSALAFLLATGAVACDDTVDAVEQETREEARETNQALEEAEARGERQAAEAEQDLEEATDEAERAIERADENLANEIREE